MIRSESLDVRLKNDYLTWQPLVKVKLPSIAVKVHSAGLHAILLVR
jgi:hypothetical protein